ncbi:MAG: helicase-associated domain-containing protein, partial [Pseudoclavibacter sp.]
KAQALALAVPGEDGPELLPVVADAVDQAIADATAVDDAPTAGSASATLDARGGERAQALSALVADLIADFDGGTRAARDGRGGPRLAGVDVRRVAADLGLPPEFIETIAGDVHRAGLAGPSGDAWVPTALGRELEHGPRIERWRSIADTWLGRISVADREAVLNATAEPEATAPTGSGGTSGGRPADESQASGARGVDAVEMATQLGLLVDGALTTAGMALLDDRLDDAQAAIDRELPAEICQVYVQPDLSVIAPGPLTPTAESDLRSLADLEQRGTASTYRLSTASLARALVGGLDPREATARLTALSIVPLPQPVTYLIAEASERHGLIRLQPFGSGTRVHSSNAEVLDRLEVDQSLGALRLQRRDDGSLDSRLAPDHVASVLAEARLPVMLEDEHGTPIGPRSRRTAPPPTLGITAAARRFAAGLLDDADRQAGGNASSAWLQQRLERARRSKTPVRLRVRIDGASPLELDAVPASMTPRWLRVIDPDADVERTFPLDAVELLDES